MPDWIEGALIRARDGDPEAVALVLRLIRTGAVGGNIDQRVLAYLADAVTAILDGKVEPNAVFNVKRKVGRQSEDERNVEIAADVALIVRYLRYSKRRPGQIAEAKGYAALLHGVSDGVVGDAWRYFRTIALERIKNWGENS